MGTDLQTALLVVDRSVVLFVVTIVLIGVGTGVHKTVDVNVFPRTYMHTGRIMGIFDTAGSYGGVAASVAVAIFVGVPQPLDRVFALLLGST